MEEGSSVITPIVVGSFTLLGVVVGIVAERLARTLGKITCEPQEEWEPQFVRSRAGAGGGWEEEPEPPEGNPNTVKYDFTLDLFNSKELPVGLRNIRIVFECKGGSVSSVSKAPETSREVAESIYTTDPLTTLNLPSRQLVSQQCRGYIEGEEVQTLTGWKVAKFVAEYPGRGCFSGGTFSKVISSRRS